MADMWVIPWSPPGAPKAHQGPPRRPPGDPWEPPWGPSGSLRSLPRHPPKIQKSIVSYNISLCKLTIYSQFKILILHDTHDKNHKFPLAPCCASNALKRFCKSNTNVLPYTLSKTQDIEETTMNQESIYSCKIPERSWLWSSRHRDFPEECIAKALSMWRFYI